MDIFEISQFVEQNYKEKQGSFYVFYKTQVWRIKKSLTSITGVDQIKAPLQDGIESALGENDLLGFMLASSSAEDYLKKTGEITEDTSFPFDFGENRYSRPNGRRYSFF